MPKLQDSNNNKPLDHSTKASQSKEDLIAKMNEIDKQESLSYKVKTFLNNLVNTFKSLFSGKTKNIAAVENPVSGVISPNVKDDKIEEKKHISPPEIGKLNTSSSTKKNRNNPLLDEDNSALNKENISKQVASTQENISKETTLTPNKHNSNVSSAVEANWDKVVHQISQTIKNSINNPAPEKTEQKNDNNSINLL